MSSVSTPPRRTELFNSTRRRTIPRSNANVWSATDSSLAPGVVVTTIPARVAASRSMLSKPTPVRAMTRSRWHSSRRAESNRSLLTMAPTTSRNSSRSSSDGRGPRLGATRRVKPADLSRPAVDASCSSNATDVTSTMSSLILAARFLWRIGGRGPCHPGTEDPSGSGSA